MKALLVTGLLAENTVKQYANQSKTITEVIALRKPVAALLSPQFIIKELKKICLKTFDLVLVPGQIMGDTQVITDELSVPVFKGPRYAADLPVVLDSLSEVKLSTVVPACDLLREKLQEKALEELKKTELNKDLLLQQRGNLLVGGVAVGKSFPMRVLAEIVDAPLLGTDEIQRLAKQYVRSGADIIDVGMLAGQNQPSEAKRAVEAVKAAVDVPVSIDTLNPLEIRAAVDSGVDLILSGDAGNLRRIAPFAKDVAVVIIPSNQRRGYFPGAVGMRVRMLERLIKQAKVLGFNKIIGDLILEPSNVLDSFVAFRDFNLRNPAVPLLIGVANVVELFDADSVGLNALLARLASQVKVDILLVTEKTRKTQGSIREAAVASKMMFLANKRDSVPSNLGLDLLVLKDRTTKEEPYDKNAEKNSKVIFAKGTEKSADSDPCGIFRIMIDRDEALVVALHFESSEIQTPLHIIKGKTAEEVLSRILGLGLVSRLDHASYLGLELANAEIALKIGKEYVQDAKLFGMV